MVVFFSQFFRWALCAARDGLRVGVRSRDTPSPTLFGDSRNFSNAEWWMFRRFPVYLNSVLSWLTGQRSPQSLSGNRPNWMHFSCRAYDLYFWHRDFSRSRRRVMKVGAVSRRLFILDTAWHLNRWGFVGSALCVCDRDIDG